MTTYLYQSDSPDRTLVDWPGAIIAVVTATHVYACPIPAFAEESLARI